MIPALTESDLEQIVLGWFGELGYTILHGPEIAPETPQSERSSYSDPLLPARVQSALSRLNPHLPPEALEEAFRKLTRIVSDSARLFDLANLENNDWVVVNQLTVVEGHNNRRPDIVIFVNGIPLGVIELKNPGDEKATIWSAFNQLQTYKEQIPSLFTFNELLVKLEWQMKQKLAPLLFAEEDREGAAKKRKDIVSPAVSSDATQKKACTPDLR